jgi:hypothetical protein
LALGIDSRLQIPDSKSGFFSDFFWNFESGICNFGPNSTAKAENENETALLGPHGKSNSRQIRLGRDGDSAFKVRIGQT